MSLLEKLKARLGIQQLLADENFPFHVVLDNGLEGIADPSDVFIDRKSGEIVPGHTEAVARALEKRANLLKPPVRNYWMEQIRGFWSGKNTARPAREGIGTGATTSLKISQGTDDKKWLKNLGDEVKEILERNGVAVQSLAPDVSAFIQDSYIPFDDGTIGISPTLEEDKRHELYAKMLSRYGSVPNSGASFVRGISDQVIRDLARTHKVRQMASWLEGGNVVLARNGQGWLKAIVGEESIQYTETFYNIGRGQAIALVAADLNMRPTDIVVIPQTDYHIDLHIRAGSESDGQIFVASQPAGSELLYYLIHRERRSGNQYDADQLQELGRRVLRAQNSEEGIKQAEALARTRDVLAKAGFNVIDYPSIYYSQKLFPENFVAVNTINNRYVHTPRGGTLNLILGTGYRLYDEAVAEFEKRHGSDQVHFIARLAAEPLAWGNKIVGKLNAGLGCLTNF